MSLLQGLLVQAVNAIKLLLCLGAVIFIGYSVHSWARLRHVPGPPLAGFTRLWKMRNLLKGELHLKLKSATETYGKH
jgi:hypothetical protein